MSIRSFILGAATLASVALPGVASAQSYGYYGGGNGYYASDRDQGYYRDRGDDRRYDARARRDEHRRWKEIERQRRREWQHRHHGREQYYNDGYRY
ncbi:hypothetical protein [uncultured Sphingomonas sp.]|uniref:hypothetical protein n=1 Tax=uncultured Sphingomonas sp. TaxID=158754 RepID=UPI0035CC9F46